MDVHAELLYGNGIGNRRSSRMRLEQYIELDRAVQGESALWKRWTADETRLAGKTDEQLLLEWSEPARTSGLRLGTAVRHALGLACVLTVVIGLLAGAGTAAGLLRYDGSQPINVLLFLVLLVGGQILLLPFLLIAFLYRRRLSGAMRLLRALVGSIVTRVARAEARRRGTNESAAELEAEWGRLQASGSLYARVQPYLLLLLVQSFGVALNVAAVATLLFLVFFSDLAFAWSTTLDVTNERVHALVSGLAAPWAAIWPEARPSLALVEATRFARFDGAYLSGPETTPAQAGAWWRFLAAATLVYGLLPRLVAFVAAWFFVRREMTRSLSRNHRVRALTERLRAPVVSISPQEPPANAMVAGAERHAATTPKELASSPLALAVVFWAYDEVPEQDAIGKMVAAATGGRAGLIAEAGHVDRPDSEALERIAQALREKEVEAVAVFFEPFEPPKTDARRFLRQVREVVGAQTPVLVLLGEFGENGMRWPDETEAGPWQNATAAMADPFLFFTSAPASASAQPGEEPDLH